MKRLIIGLLTLSLIFNTGCSLFKKQQNNKHQQIQQTSQNIKKSINEIKWQDIYIHILNNGFAVNDTEKISKTILSWKARQDKNNSVLYLKGQSNQGKLEANLNLTSSGITTLQNGNIKSIYDYNLNLNSKANFKGQNVNISGNIQLSLFLKNIETYIKLNVLNLKQNVNPLYDTILSMYTKNIIGKWIKLTSKNLYNKNKPFKIDYTSYVKFISNILEDINKYPIISSYKEEFENKTNEKIFYVKLDKKNLKKVLKNAFEQIPNILQSTKEEKEKIKEHLEGQYKKLEEVLNLGTEFTGKASVKSINNFIIDFGEKKLKGGTINIKIIGNGKDNTYLQVKIEIENGKLTVKTGKIKGKYTIEGNLNIPDGDISGHLTIKNYNINNNEFIYTLESVGKGQMKNKQNNIDFIVTISTDNISKKVENINVKEPSKFLTIEQVMEQILKGSNILPSTNNQQFNVEKLKK